MDFLSQFNIPTHLKAFGYIKQESFHPFFFVFKKNDHFVYVYNNSEKDGIRFVDNHLNVGGKKELFYLAVDTVVFDGVL